jgi:hypothetical protein
VLSDPDGDPITLVQSPAQPYGIGSTEVTLTATDTSNESDACTATVTIVDVTAPALSYGPGVNPGGNEPKANNEDGVYLVTGGVRARQRRARSARSR